MSAGEAFLEEPGAQGIHVAGAEDGRNARLDPALSQSSAPCYKHNLLCSLVEGRGLEDSIVLAGTGPTKPTRRQEKGFDRALLIPL